MAWLVVAKYDGIQSLFMQAANGAIRFKDSPEEALQLARRKDAEEIARCWSGCEPYEYN